MTGELRDSFRQAMSELFMGDDRKKSKNLEQADATADDTLMDLDSPFPTAARPIDRSQIDRRPSSGYSSVERSDGSDTPTDKNQSEAMRPPAASGTTGTSDSQSGATKSAATTPVPATARPAAASGARPGVSAASPARQRDVKSTDEDDYAMPAVFSVDAFKPVSVDDSSDDDPIEPRQQDGSDADARPTGGQARPTIIAEGTEITGEVKFGSNAEVYGVLHGNVRSQDNIVTNTGSIVGDVVARNMDMINAEVKGDVATAGDFRVNDNSVMVGNVEATRMDLRGTITGDSAVSKEINVHSSAKLSGDVEAGSIAIGHGAKVKGYINVGSDDEEE